MLRLSIPDPEGIFNEAFLPYLYCDTPIQIFFGGASSGKSAFVAQRTALDLMLGNRNFLYLRNVANTIRTSCFTELQRAIAQMGLSAHFAVSESTLEITCLQSGYTAYFRGLDDVEKLKSIVPMKGVITDIVIEEATEANEAAYNQLLLRMRGEGDSSHVRKRVCLLFNPIDRQHWIARRYFQGWADGQRVKQDTGLLIHHSTHRDNRFLTEDDHQRIEAFKEIDPYYYSVYACGQWGIIGNTILRNWRIEDLSGMDRSTLKLRYGLDFGYANDPAACIETARVNNRLYITKEIAYAKGLTNQTLGDIIRGPCAGQPVKCDCAEPKSIAELAYRGVAAYPAGKPRRIGGLAEGTGSWLLFAIQWLQQQEIIIDSRCQNVISEISTWRWKQDARGNVFAQPVDKNDHAISAIMYAYSDDMDSGIGACGVEVLTAGRSERERDENARNADMALLGVG